MIKRYTPVFHVNNDLEKSIQFMENPNGAIVMYTDVQGSEEHQVLLKLNEVGEEHGCPAGIRTLELIKVKLRELKALREESRLINEKAQAAGFATTYEAITIAANTNRIATQWEQLKEIHDHALTAFRRMGFLSVTEAVDALTRLHAQLDGLGIHTFSGAVTALQEHAYDSEDDDADDEDCPTPMTEDDIELKVGDVWHIQYPNAIALVTVEIVELTKRTVVLVERDSTYSRGNRYRTSDIEFIERV